MEPVLIREAVPGDCNSIYDLNCEEMGYEYDLESTRRRLAFLLNAGGHKLFVAQCGGEVVGYIHASDYDLIYSEPMKNIMGVAVRGNAKRQGIGRLLLNAVEDWARCTGAAGVRLTSGMSRTGAHAFYAACGYETRKDQKNFMKTF